MSMTKYENQTLTRKVFRLEECWFVNCTLVECTLFYSGGSYTWEKSQFQNCEWKLQGPAQATFLLMTQIGLLPTQPAPGQLKTSMGGSVN